MKNGTISTHKIKLKRKKHKYTTKEKHQTTKKESKGRRNEQRRTIKNDWKTINKMQLF